MRRLIFTLLLLVSALSAGAWNRSSYAAIMALASQSLSPEVGAAVKSTLGGDLAAATISDRALNTFSVDENYTPLRKGERDALLVAEQCVERLRHNKKDREAILLLAKAVADMHSVTNLRIEGDDFTNNNHTVRRWNNRKGESARYTDVKWRTLWNSYFPGRHILFTAEMYAYDIDLYYSRYRTKYTEGGVADWVVDVVKELRGIYADNLCDRSILAKERVNEYELIHDRLMAKAAYRIATILNDILR